MDFPLDFEGLLLAVLNEFAHCWNQETCEMLFDDIYFLLKHTR